MIVEVDIGEIKETDVKKELVISAQKVKTLMEDLKGDPLTNLVELATQSLRMVELYKLFEK